MGKQYFCPYQQVVSTLYFIFYLPLIVIPHYLRQLTFSPPPPPLTEYAATPARVGIIKSKTVLPLTADEALAVSETLLRPPRFSRCIFGLSYLKPEHRTFGDAYFIAHVAASDKGLPPP